MLNTLRDGGTSQQAASGAKREEEESTWRSVVMLKYTDGRLIATTEKNVKAFAFANPGRLNRQAARAQDVSTRRLLAKCMADLLRFRSKKSAYMFPLSIDYLKRRHPSLLQSSAHLALAKLPSSNPSSSDTPSRRSLILLDPSQSSPRSAGASPSSNVLPIL